MKEKINAIAASINPFIEGLKKHRSQSYVGELLMPFRSEKLMRNVTYQHQPVDCLLMAIGHLKKDENDLGEALAWLNQGNIAYTENKNPDYWHELANVIRLDIMTQLNGLRLTHVWKSEREASKQLSSAKLENVAKDKLINTQKLLIGLLGYHLGRGLELNEEAVAAYKKLLSKITDSNLVKPIEDRIKALNENSYLDPNDFNMSREEFEILGHYKAEFQDFIDECCLKGAVPKRPEFDEKMTKTAYELAGISVYAGPLALIAIPSVLIATPVLKVIDRINYQKDQQENEIFYATLDDAHEWIKANIKKQAEKCCPNFHSIFAEVETLERKFSAPDLFMKDNNFDQKLKAIKSSIMFDKYYLGEEKIYCMNKILNDVEKDIKQLDLYQQKISAAGWLASIFLGYLKNTNKQLQYHDGKYHPDAYECYESRKYDGISLSEMPTILHSFENEFELNCEQTSTLARDITSRLKNVQTEIKETVDKKRENARNQNEKAAQLENNIRKSYF